MIRILPEIASPAPARRGLSLSSLGLMRALCLGIVFALVTATAGEPPRDYSKAILGCWLGFRKFEIYHANGTWGVKRNEGAPEEITGRRWHIKGNKLIITYPGDHGLETGVFTIASLTEHKMVLRGSGYEELTRYSPGCQKGDLTRRCSRRLAGLFPPALMIKILPETAMRALVRRG